MCDGLLLREVLGSLISRSTVLFLELVDVGGDFTGLINSSLKGDLTVRRLLLHNLVSLLLLLAVLMLVVVLMLGVLVLIGVFSGFGCLLCGSLGSLGLPLGLEGVR